MIEELKARIAELERQQAVLVEALNHTAQYIAWREFGECRGFDAAIATPAQVIEIARAALAEAKKAGEVSVSTAASDVLAERRRQVEAEGWTPEHDDAHDNGCLEMAASCYAYHVADPDPEGEDRAPFGWPWDVRWWKPSTPRRDLVKAGALILAAIERRDRAIAKNSTVMINGFTEAETTASASVAGLMGGE